MTYLEHITLKMYLLLGFYKETGEGLEPVYCTKCGTGSYKDTTTSTISGLPCEVERSCVNDHSMGYWCYGYWQI